MTSSLFLYVEAQQRVYDSQAYSTGLQVKPKETQGIIGIGWKF
jgi:hypothetical protein